MDPRITQVIAFQGLGQVSAPPELASVFCNIPSRKGGRDWQTLYRTVPAFREAVVWGQDILEQHRVRVEEQPLDLAKVCEQGFLPLEYHSPTVWEQPLIFLANTAAWETRKPQLNLRKGTVFLGLSMGEWFAIVAAGCLSKEKGLLAVVWRGICMSETKSRGTSLLVIGKEPLHFKSARIRYNLVGKEVWVGNINSPFQAIFSGNPRQLAEIGEELTQRNLTVMWFNLGEAVHTPYMEPARVGLTALLKDWKFNKPDFPVLCNATGEASKNPQTIKELLLRQIRCRLDLRKTARAIPPGTPIEEILVVPGSTNIVEPLIRQTHRFCVPSRKLARAPSPT